MDSLYQLRKDIDKLYSKFFDVESGEWDISSREELDGILERLNADNSLDILEANLNTFSQDLEDYSESLESFGEQLTEYGGDLTEFSGELSGFSTTITSLRTWVYGYDPQNPSAHSYNDPTSDSMKGMIDSLQQLVADLQTGDGVVLENLGRLKDHIQAFSGTLQQFKNYLTQQGVNVSTLNDNVLSLILELNKSLDVISDHQDLLEEAQEIIGEPSTSSTQATGIFKRLEDGEEVMEGVSSQADALDVIVNGDPQVQSDTGLVGATSSLQTTVGNNSSGLIKQTNDIINTIGEPSSGGEPATGLHLAIDNAQSTASAVTGVAENIKEKIGYNSIGNVNLQSQITTTNGLIGTVPSGSTLQGQIDTHDNKIGNVDYVNDGSLQSQVDDTNTDIGTVDQPRDGSLQTQIAGIVDMLYSFCFGCKTVATMNDLDNVDPRWYRVCYVTETGAYYEYTGDDILGG